MNNLFVYGTLLCEDIFVTVSGCRRRGVNSILQDYRRLRVRGEHYPGIIPAPGNRVEGLLYFDIPQPAWRRLDRFEGDMYRRRPVEVEPLAGGLEKALVYVVRPEFAPCLEWQEWDLNEFLARGRKPVEEFCRGDLDLKLDNFAERIMHEPEAIGRNEQMPSWRERPLRWRTSTGPVSAGHPRQSC